MADRERRETPGKRMAKLVFLVLIVAVIVIRVTGDGELFRSEDSMIFGVAGGVAEYLDVNPTVVRVIWAVSALYYGVGVGAYLLAWLLIPAR